MPKALTIAGSDSGGGAGIQADLKTFAAHGVYGTSVLTAITAQNTVAVTAVHEISTDVIAAQLDAVLTDIGTDAAKTGMLSSAAIIATVADGIRRHSIANLVVDPVMVAKSGDHLLRREAVGALRELLLPLALVVTPNIPEAEVLAEMTIATDADRREAARRIAAFGPRYAIGVMVLPS
jgi:hydroxymethylpyrimidine/phosphomethylpyrimidine kinase